MQQPSQPQPAQPSRPLLERIAAASRARVLARLAADPFAVVALERQQPSIGSR